jgi:hypothetical protein
MTHAVTLKLTPMQARRMLDLLFQALDQSHGEQLRAVQACINAVARPLCRADGPRPFDTPVTPVCAHHVRDALTRLDRPQTGQFLAQLNAGLRNLSDTRNLRALPPPGFLASRAAPCTPTTGATVLERATGAGALEVFDRVATRALDPFQLPGRMALDPFTKDKG